MTSTDNGLMNSGYQPQEDLLKDKAVLVTGAGDGIGKICARTYAEYGATVILSGRTQSKLEAVYDEIVALDCPHPVLLPVDLAMTQSEFYQQIAAGVFNQFKVLHGLVNNASILGPKVPLSNYSPTDFMAVMQVNLTSVFLLTQALMPALEAADHASVIMTSSGVGRMTRAYWGAYSVSKHGIEALTGIWAEENAQTSGVRFNSLDPGATRTGMRAKAYPGEDPNSLPTPEALMPLYLYLMSNDSIGVTGQRLSAQNWRYSFNPG